VWVATIERLFDDEAFYPEPRWRALERAAVWDPARLRPDVEAYFRRIACGLV